jgi:flagellar basal body-associated protein FliL
MQITSFILLFALFGHTNARLNNADGVEQDQRALGNGNGNNGNDKGNGITGNGKNGNGNGNNGNGNGNGNGGGPNQFAESRPLVTPPQQELRYANTPPLVSDFAAGNDDDVVDILVFYKNNNGKAKAKGKAKKINQELRLGDIIAMTATKQEIRELALDADIE